MVRHARPVTVANPACMVCGATMMARAHLFPRALMHEIRRDEKHMLAISAFAGGRPGYLQSGEVSTRILCHRHEKATQRFDDAAIRMIRTFSQRARLAYEGRAWHVANPKADDLTRFIHATIWRHWAHWLAGETGPNFNRTALPALRGVVFDGEQPFATMVMETERVHRGERAHIAFVPGETMIDGMALIRFEIGGFAFFLRPGYYYLPAPWHAFSAASQPDLFVLKLAQGELSSDPTIMSFVKNTPPAR